jgi:YD repeat-containing protein
VYDVKGQIIGVIDVHGSVATYAWDENGNLAGTARITPGAGPVAISLVSPKPDLPGDIVESLGK